MCVCAYFHVCTSVCRCFISNNKSFVRQAPKMYRSEETLMYVVLSLALLLACAIDGNGSGIILSRGGGNGSTFV